MACYRIGQIQRLFKEVSAAAVGRLDAAAAAAEGEATPKADTLMREILADASPSRA